MRSVNSGGSSAWGIGPGWMSESFTSVECIITSHSRYACGGRERLTFALRHRRIATPPDEAHHGEAHQKQRNLAQDAKERHEPGPCDDAVVESDKHVHSG